MNYGTRCAAHRGRRLVWRSGGAHGLRQHAADPITRPKWNRHAGHRHAGRSLLSSKLVILLLSPEAVGLLLSCARGSENPGSHNCVGCYASGHARSTVPSVECVCACAEHCSALTDTHRSTCVSLYSQPKQTTKKRTTLLSLRTHGTARGLRPRRHFPSDRCHRPSPPPAAPRPAGSFPHNSTRTRPARS